jgi:methylmalonyl-CoA mutase N-terminal domain/subunit
VANTVDPLAGSYFVEGLTDRMEREARAYLDKIDQLGGIVAAIEAGFPQREIAEASYRYQQQIDAREKIVVGVNRYTMEEAEPVETLRIDDAVERDQREGLERIKRERDENEVQRRLGLLVEAARGSENTMPRILDAVRAYATVGEICGVLKPVFGEYRETSVF